MDYRFLCRCITGRRMLSAAVLVALLVGASLTAAAQAPRQENGTVFDAPSAKIYYEVIGSGAATPLVVVNGGPGFDHTYLHIARVWDTLSKNRRIVFYDQRGMGRSAPLEPRQSCTLADQIADLEALRAHLGFERIDLLGHSWGGYLAMAYVARHPERVAHLALVDSAAPKWSDTIFLFSQAFPEVTERRAALAFADEMGDPAASAASIHEYLSMLFYSTEARDRFLAAMPPTAFNKRVNQLVTQEVARFDLNPELSKFGFPTLVVTGRYDMNVAPLIAYRIHQAIPNSQFVVFEHSGHIPFYEEPEGFARMLENFLTGNKE